MSKLEKKHISVKKFHNLEEFKNCNNLISEEVIEIENFSEQKDISQKDFFFMPNYITYYRETDTVDNILQKLSKNKRKKIKKGFKECEKFEIIKQANVIEETYKEWYQIYLTSIENKEIGIISASKDWATSKLDQCQKVAIFLKNKNKIIAGIVARSYPKNDFLPQRLSISFSAIESNYKHLAINDYLNALFIEFAKELNYEYIFRGKDTNLYGKHLSAGIPVFKTSLGYKIIPLKKEKDILIKFNDLTKFNNIILFFTYSEDKEKLNANLILKEETTEDILNQYKFSFINKLNIYRYEDKQITQIY